MCSIVRILCNEVIIGFFVHAHFVFALIKKNTFFRSKDYDIHQWRKKLKIETIRKVEEDCKELMKLMKYSKFIEGED